MFSKHTIPLKIARQFTKRFSKESVDFITYLFAVRANLKLTFINYELGTMERNYYDIALYTSHAMDQTD